MWDQLSCKILRKILQNRDTIFCENFAMAVAVPTPVIVDDDDEMEFMDRLMPALGLNFLM